GVEMGVYPGDVLDFNEVMHRFKIQMQWLAELYVHTMNTIHYMHDRYAYERVQMALHDSRVHYFMSFGIAGLSVVADSLSAIRYARVKPVRNAQGLIEDFIVEGNYPKFGNDDD
ncbi:MAG TPA: formate acetyltransferase, partial [Syntrophomonas sp.]|nr:formate acetyltransferase [Syntrophomonas sp.]